MPAPSPATAAANAAALSPPLSATPPDAAAHPGHVRHPSDDSLDDPDELLEDVDDDDVDDVEDDDGDDDDDNVELQQDGNSVVGFSIGPLQRQLSSTKATLAQRDDALNSFASKNAARNDDERPLFAASIAPRRPNVPRLNTLPHPQHAATAPAIMPSPWQAKPRDRWTKPDGTKARARAQSNLLFGDFEASLKKYLGKLSLNDHRPRFAAFLSNDGPASAIDSGSSSAAAPRAGPGKGKASDESKHWVWPALPEDPGMSAEMRDALTPMAETPAKANPPRPKMLRRSTSEGSLTLQRAPSAASSLGDDARWADVHEQVNVRFKAIRDSLADSLADSTSLHLPKFSDLSTLSLPRTLPAFRSRTSLASTAKSASPPKTALAPLSSPPRSGVTSPNGHLMAPPENASKTSATSHPHLHKALRKLHGDVVMMGGYRGSILRDAQPPHRQLWVPIKVGLNIRKVHLEVGLEHEDEENMPDTIIPGGMLAHIGPVDVSKRLFGRLRSSANAKKGLLRVWDYGYDWRLSPHLLSRQLIQFLEELPCNQPGVPGEQRGATVIAHSLGGLITRHACNQRPDLFAGIVYVGVPQNCINILGPLRNGDDVLLSSKVLTAQVNFTFRTSFALLPLDGVCFVDSDTGEEYPVDFFDPKTWDEFRLSPCIARPYPPAESAAQAGPISNFRGSISSVLPAITGRRNSSPRRASTMPQQSSVAVGSPPLGTQMDQSTHPLELGQDPENNIKTAVTLPRDRAWRYLCRTLAEVKQFKEELACRPAWHELGVYPPTAVMYGKSIPTVSRAQVKGREGIKHADAYDNLAFASGDGVVLARAAQLPPGYSASPGGVVSTERGHVSMLTDLEAVGKCLNAILAERRRRRPGKRQTAAAHGAAGAA